MMSFVPVLTSPVPTLTTPVIASVTITGNGFVGSVHQANWTGSSAGQEPIWQWTAGGIDISDATDATYQPPAAIAALRVRLLIGAVTLTSDPVAITEMTPDAPVLVSAGTIISSGSLGKIGHPHLVDGFDATGEDVATFIGFYRDDVAISGATVPGYIPVSADDSTDLTGKTTASNLGGSVIGTTPAIAITYEAPTALDTGVWSVAEDAGSATYEAATGSTALFEVLGDAMLADCAFALVGSTTGLSIDADTGILTQTATTALAATVTVSCTNSGGTTTNTIAHSVVAPPITAPTITAIADQSLSVNATTTTQISVTVAGTETISLSVAPVVVKPVIEESPDDTYGFNQLYYSGATTAVYEQRWLVDGVDTGQTGAIFDNTTPAYGDAATASLVVEARVDAGAWVASDAVTITGASLGVVVGDVPVHLSTTTTGGNGALSYAIPGGAYSAGNYVLLRVATDHADAGTTIGGVGKAALVGPNDETIVPIHDSVTTGTGDGGHSFRMWGYKALGAQAAPEFTVTINRTRQIQGAISVYSHARDINPITDTVTLISTADPVLSPVTTATTADGLVEFACGVELAPITGTAANWTQRGNDDEGGICIYVAQRDAATTESEAIGSASFDRAAAGDDVVGVTYVINGGVAPDPPASGAYDSVLSGVVPKFVMDFEDEVYLLNATGAGDALVAVDIDDIMTGFSSLATQGGAQGMVVGTGIIPRIPLGQWWNAAAFSIEIEFRMTAAAAGSLLLHVNDGTNTTCILCSTNGTDWRHLARIGGTSQFSIQSIGAVAIDTVQKLVLSWTEGDYGGSLAGAAAVSPGAGTRLIPQGMLTLNICHNNGVGNQPTGIVTRIVGWAVKLPNAELDDQSGA
jgi:hypothetical protein